MATIFFDYDGTLHDTMRIYGPAWRAGFEKLADEGVGEHLEFTDEWISKGLGLNLRDMWETMMPHIPKQYWKPTSKFILDKMNEMLERGEGSLFEGIPQALSELKGQGHTLVFLSNCEKAYMEQHARAYKLDAWIDAFFCAQDFPGKQKWEIYEEVAPRFEQPHIMVGDREKDMEVAQHGSCLGVGCLWGYGSAQELRAADTLCETPANLVPAINKLLALS